MRQRVRLAVDFFLSTVVRADQNLGNKGALPKGSPFDTVSKTVLLPSI